jgi:hypothetical protein
MNELIKCMLAIGAGFSPDNRSSMIVDVLSTPRYRLAIGFHISLLEIGSKTMHVLVIGKEGVALGLVEVDVPDSYQSQQHWDLKRTAKFTDQG